MGKSYKELTGDINQALGEIRKGAPEVLQAFHSLSQAATCDGALNKKTKELIALGIAITVRCDGCIAFHVHDALAAGASRAEITECIGVAILMGGGPSVMYGCEALEALEQFKAQEN